MTLRPSMAAAIGAALIALPAQAQTPDQDVRCLVAANTFATAEKDPPKKQLALATALFFAGRADARLAPAQLKAQIVGQGNALNLQNVAEVMTACARTFQAKQRTMQAIGQEIARAQPKK